jgi:5-methylcytosine-specific restriction endonuclease McrA
LSVARRPLPDILRAAIFARDSGCCLYCGASFADVPITIDHVVPVVRGGSDDAANLATACEACNREKGVIHLEAYLLHRELTGQGSEGARERLSAALAKPLEMKAALEFLTWLRAQRR